MLHKDCGRCDVSRPCHLSTCVIAPLVQDVLAVIPRNFLSLRGVPVDDIDPGGHSRFRETRPG
jgi:hypothetical protein